MLERIAKSLAYGAAATALSLVMTLGFRDASAIVPMILTFAGMSAVAYLFVFDHLA